MVWPGTFVSEANLSVLIAEIRRVLGDPPRNPVFVRTVHRFGYAFCGSAVNVSASQISITDGGRSYRVGDDRCSLSHRVSGFDPTSRCRGFRSRRHRARSSCRWRDAWVNVLVRLGRDGLLVSLPIHPRERASDDAGRAPRDIHEPALYRHPELPGPALPLAVGAVTPTINGTGSPVRSVRLASKRAPNNVPSRTAATAPSARDSHGTHLSLRLQSAVFSTFGQLSGALK